MAMMNPCKCSLSILKSSTSGIFAYITAT
jgi:hypothetical protein